MTYRTASPDDTARFGSALGTLLAPGDTVFLNGDLGAGKSVLARGIASGLGVTGPMPSPTFTLMQPYMGRCPFYHFDLYRLSDEEEIYAAGLDEYIGTDGVAVVEWPDLLDVPAGSVIDAQIDRCDEDDLRHVELTFSGFDEDRLDEIRRALSPWRME